MKKIKSFSYEETGSEKCIAFELSNRGNIDCSKYSLLEVLHDERLQQLSFESRHEIMNSFLNDMHSINHYSYRREVLSACKPETLVNDYITGQHKNMLNLASNDYLNLSQHPRVKDAAAKALSEYGLGSGSPPMFTGTTTLHKALEKKYAAFKGCEEAMLFASGYGANFGTLRALLGKDDAAIFDMYAHASLIDGCTNTNRYYFKHNDIESLEWTLKKAAPHKNKLVILDGVYSMDGDVARLDKIIEVAHHYGAWVLVDDAHATGVIGKNGHGTLEHFGLQGKIDLVTDTFSKGLGAVGGVVAGKKELIRFLQVACRAYMFSTSPAMPVVAGVSEALNVIDDEPQLIRNIKSHINYFKMRINEIGFNTGDTQSAIIPIIIGNDFLVKEMTYQLHKAGILVNAVPYPAVPKKSTRIRITLTSALTKQQLDFAIAEIERIGLDLGIIKQHEFLMAA